MPTCRFAFRAAVLCLAMFGNLLRPALGQTILAEAYLESADAARAASDIGKAARLYALALTESHDCQHPLLLARALIGAAAIHIELNELKQAEENVRAAMALCDSLADPTPELTPASLNCMAMITYHRGDFELAEACYQRLLEGLGDANDSSSEVVRAIVLNDLALVKLALNQPEQGRLLAMAAADVMHAHYGPESAHYAQCLDTLAQMYHAGDQLDIAERLSRASLSICEADIGQDSAQFGSALMTLGKIQHRRGQHREGIESAEQSVAIQQRHRGPGHPLVHRARHAHQTLLATLPGAERVQPPNDDERKMFDEMYGDAGLQPEELAALKSDWSRITGSERLARYLDFHAAVATRIRLASNTSPANGVTLNPVPNGDDLFHELFGRHNLPPEELKAFQDHWNGMTPEQRRAAADLFRKSTRSTSKPQ